jgi:flavodoxin
MKTLVAYYSRTGITQKVALAVAKALSADVEELIDTKNRKGTLGFIVAGKDAATKKLVPIQPPQRHPGEYDLVILGTPVWANTMSSAVRMYLTDFGKDIRRAGFFCTTHSSGIESTWSQMEELLGKPPVATAGFRQKHVKRDEHLAALDAFLEKLRKEP